jgi:hypothetical protein
MSGLINNGLSSWNSIYLYPVVPFVASFLAILFYECVYKKTQAFLAHDDDCSDNGGVHDEAGEHD